MFRKCRILNIVTLALLIISVQLPAGASAAKPPVPHPMHTPVEVVISGHTSTLLNMQIKHVGQNIPRTFSDGYTTNTPGFSWYVSRHYALKTDYPADMAEFYLSLLEMAWPHYTEVFGGEPDTSSKRLAVVYASTDSMLRKAMKSDGEGWFQGGGITMFRTKIAYMYQSYPVEVAWDQPRYIVLHEGAHQFQMALFGHLEPTPIWYYEGVADRFASHVYEKNTRRLTVNVFDKAGPLNMIQEGLDQWRQSPSGSFARQIREGEWGTRGKAAVMTAFFNSTPDRMQRFRLYRDEMTRARSASSSAGIMEKVFGSLDVLGSEFERWASEQRLTFRADGRQWAQDADTLWASASRPGSGRVAWEQVLLAPADEPQKNIFRLDHPPQNTPAIIGPVHRGVAEPSVACVVDLSRNPEKGSAGFGLGVRSKTEDRNPPEGMALLIDSSRQLVIDGRPVGIEYASLDLPENMREAIAAGGHRAGITAKILSDALEITVRAKHPEKKNVDMFVVRVPLMPFQRARLMLMGMAIFSRDGYHGVTHYFDPGPRDCPDLLTPAPANIWRNPADKELYALYRVAHRLGDKTPQSLLRLRNYMAAAADKDPDMQAKALNYYRNQLPAILYEIQDHDAASMLKQ